MNPASDRDYARQWLERRQAETSPATHRRYGNAIDKWLEFLGPDADRGIEEVTEGQVFAFRDARAKASATLTANIELKASTPASAWEIWPCSPGARSILIATRSGSLPGKPASNY